MRKLQHFHCTTKQQCWWEITLINIIGKMWKFCIENCCMLPVLSTEMSFPLCLKLVISLVFRAWIWNTCLVLGDDLVCPRWKPCQSAWCGIQRSSFSKIFFQPFQQGQTHKNALYITTGLQGENWLISLIHKKGQFSCEGHTTQISLITKTWML